MCLLTPVLGLITVSVSTVGTASNLPTQNPPCIEQEYEQHRLEVSRYIFRFLAFVRYTMHQLTLNEPKKLLWLTF